MIDAELAKKSDIVIGLTEHKGDVERLKVTRNEHWVGPHKEAMTGRRWVGPYKMPGAGWHSKAVLYEYIRHRAINGGFYIITTSQEQ